MLMLVARREAAAMFRTPFAWSVFAAVQFIIAYQFLAQIDLFTAYLPRIRSMPQPLGVTQLVVTPTFGVASLLLLVLIPVLTMNAFSGERRQSTLVLWYSAPITLTELVLGKFVGVCCLLFAVISLNALMPLTLLWGTTLDLGVYVGGLLGLTGIAVSGAAMGMLFSSLTSHPALAAITTLASLLMLWLIDWTSQLDQAPGPLAQISLFMHFQNLAAGFVTSADVAYFCGITLAALALTVWRLDGERRAL